MKKIGLYLGAEPSLGGTFQYCQTVLDAVESLARKQLFEVVAAYSSRLWEPYLAEYSIKSVYFHRSYMGRAAAAAWQRARLPMSAWRSVAPSVHGFTKQFLKERCDLWIFGSQESHSYRVPVPALASIHDLMHRYENRFPEVSHHGEFRRREYHYRNVCRWSTAVLVDSTIGMAQVQESYGVATERIKVLPFAPPKYIFSRESPAGFDDRYELPERFVFYPAQFWEHKNHKSLVWAASKILPVAKDLHLVFVGARKNAFDSTVRLIADLGLTERVVILGYVPDADMAELYRRARCMVFPSFFGPTNIPPLEAFVTGCPLAVSDIYGMAEQVGDAALLFDPGSVDEIADAMLRLWLDDNLCKRLRCRGRQQLRWRNQTAFNVRLSEILHEVLQCKVEFCSEVQ